MVLRSGRDTTGETHGGSFAGKRHANTKGAKIKQEILEMNTGNTRARIKIQGNSPVTNRSQ